ncbi:EcsC family protein [Salsuginibacillus kocurii]|uniref:EcsC family protein n=1 Tax=Salsuginibacillus kocurii TaxID=427078 RepID=UPI000370A787|nr:EcsC family protein [Salsuginibacillus kocurii]
MPLTDQERDRLRAIEEWETEFVTDHTIEAERLSLNWTKDTFERLSKQKQQSVLDRIDQFLFYAQSITLNTKLHQEAEERLINAARVFQSDIQQIEDLGQLRLEQLNYLLLQQTAKQRLLSLGQGGAAGFGGPLLLGTDLICMLLINLRTVQLTAMTYGYDLRSPYELMTALSVFHAASLPKGAREEAWKGLQERMGDEIDPYFYDEEEDIIDANWLQQPLRQAVKAVVLSSLRKKAIQGLPVIGMAVGATINYRFSQQVSTIARHYYEKRWIIDKERLNGSTFTE